MFEHVCAVAFSVSFLDAAGLQLEMLMAMLPDMKKVELLFMTWT
jgi:hypothetical protein